MFENIGNKIMLLAKIIAWIGIIISIISGFVIMASQEQFFLGVITGGLGALCSWIGSFMIYAFGQLVDDVSAIKEKTLKNNDN